MKSQLTVESRIDRAENAMRFGCLLLRPSAKLRIRAAQECFKVAFRRRSEVASECPEVVSELVRDIFEFFDLIFQGKEIISMRKHYFWKK